MSSSGLDHDADATVSPSNDPASSVPVQLSAAAVDAIRRALKVDEPTARFYLGEANGNLKRALQMYQEDQAWESTGGARTQAHMNPPASVSSSSSAAALARHERARAASSSKPSPSATSSRAAAALRSPGTTSSTPSGGRGSSSLGSEFAGGAGNAGEGSPKVPGKDLGDLVHTATKRFGKLLRSASGRLAAYLEIGKRPDAVESSL